jgi:hypothetical protein
VVEFSHEMKCGKDGSHVENIWVQDASNNQSKMVVPFFEDLTCENSSRFEFAITTHAKGFLRPFLKSSRYGVWFGNLVPIPSPWNVDDDGAMVAKELQSMLAENMKEKDKMVEGFVSQHKELRDLYKSNPSEALAKINTDEHQEMIMFMKRNPSLYQEALAEIGDSPFLEIMMAPSPPLTAEEARARVASLFKKVKNGKLL